MRNAEKSPCCNEEIVTVSYEYHPVSSNPFSCGVIHALEWDVCEKCGEEL